MWVRPPPSAQLCIDKCNKIKFFAMDTSQQNNIEESIIKEQKLSFITKSKKSFFTWKKKNITWKNVFSIFGIFVIMMIFSQVVENYGYKKGLKDAINRGTEINFWSTQNVFGMSNQKSESNWFVFWDIWSRIKNDYIDGKKVTDEKMIENAIRGLVASTEDPFSEYLTQEDYKELNSELQGSFDGIGAEISRRNGQVVIVSPLKDTPAYKAGLKPGDIILEVDGVSTVDATSNEVVKLIRGKKGTVVNIVVFRESTYEKKVFNITRNKIDVPSLEMEETSDGIIILKIYNFYDPLLAQFDRAVQLIKEKNPKGIIVDLRNNPGGYLDAYIDMGQYFFKRGQSLLIEDFGGKKDSEIYRANRDGELRNHKMVVLVNEGTASAAEILAGALRDNNNVLIVGEKSFGKGSVQELMPIRNNNFLKLTIAYWLTPKGINISKKGIVPDIKVEVKDVDNTTSTYEKSDLTKDIQLKRAYDELLKLIK